jgi:hypothetical protein
MSNRTVVACRRCLLGVALVFGITAFCGSSWAATPDKNDVIFLTTEEFPYAEAVALAQTVKASTGLQARAMLPFGTAGWKATWGGFQYDAVTLVALARPAIAQLKTGYGGTLLIILTTKDINQPDSGLRFLFVYHDNEPIAVVSVARAQYTGEGALASADVVRERLAKLALRTIAIRYYHYERNTDLASVLYSPLMSVDDLDHMGRKPFAQTTTGPGGFE